MAACCPALPSSLVPRPHARARTRGVRCARAHSRLLVVYCAARSRVRPRGLAGSAGRVARVGASIRPARARRRESARIRAGAEALCRGARSLPRRRASGGAGEGVTQRQSAGGGRECGPTPTTSGGRKRERFAGMSSMFARRADVSSERASLGVRFLAESLTSRQASLTSVGQACGQETIIGKTPKASFLFKGARRSGCFGAEEAHQTQAFPFCAKL